MDGEPPLLAEVFGLACRHVNKKNMFIQRQIDMHGDHRIL